MRESNELDKVIRKNLETLGDFLMNKLDQLLAQIDTLKQKLDSLRSRDNDSIRDALDIQYTYDSNRIEGNTLTLRETDIIIHKGLTVSGKSMREHLEATNHYEAVHFIRDLVKDNITVSSNIVKQIHAIILQGVDRENAGVYRSVPVAISGSRHIPPQPLLIPDLMEDFDSYIQKDSLQLHPVIVAADVHEKIATIHPFTDGNGRTARLVMNLVLMQHGYPIANIPGDTDSRLAYYSALEKFNTDNDKEDFYLLIGKYVLEGLNNLLYRIG